MGSNNRVVVNPVHLESLEKFGNPQFVADKLIQVEKQESTQEAEVVRFAERSEFEYVVDSSRGGMKRKFFCSICGLKEALSS